MDRGSETVIFTDGSSRGNPGPGGWGAVVIAGGDHVIELGGGERETTNNRMELMAAMKAFEKSPEDQFTTIYTDSSYLINGITRWVVGWKRNGWKTKAKQDVLNRDLWEGLHALTKDRQIKWHYVGGHIGILGNERCDHIATDFADGNAVKLYSGKLSDYDLPKILDISFDEAQMKAKKSDSSRSRAKAYSYVSMLDGVIEVHHTWTECEGRVKGKKGARYKKSLDKADELSIVREFGTFTI